MGISRSPSLSVCATQGYWNFRLLAFSVGKLPKFSTQNWKSHVNSNNNSSSSNGNSTRFVRYSTCYWVVYPPISQPVSQSVNQSPSLSPSLFSLSLSLFAAFRWLVEIKWSEIDAPPTLFIWAAAGRERNPLWVWRVRRRFTELPAGGPLPTHTASPAGTMRAAVNVSMEMYAVYFEWIC